jgi:hypothetical protein
MIISKRGEIAQMAVGIVTIGVVAVIGITMINEVGPLLEDMNATSTPFVANITASYNFLGLTYESLPGWMMVFLVAGFSAIIIGLLVNVFRSRGFVDAFVPEEEDGMIEDNKDNDEVVAEVKKKKYVPEYKPKIEEPQFKDEKSRFD